MPERSESAQRKVVVIVLPVHKLAFVHFSMLVIQLRRLQVDAGKLYAYLCSQEGAAAAHEADVSKALSDEHHSEVR